MDIVARTLILSLFSFLSWNCLSQNKYPLDNSTSQGTPEKQIQETNISNSSNQKATEKPAQETGHTKNVSGVLYNPDGSYIASWSDDLTIKIWDVASESVMKTLRGHTKPVSDVAFSPDGKTLISSSQDNTIRIWDVVNGQNVRVIGGNEQGNINSISYRPDGKEFSSASWVHKTITIWNSSNGQQIKKLTGHQQPVIYVAYSPDGKRIASRSMDEVRVWDVRTSSVIFSVPVKMSLWPYASVAYSPDGKYIAISDGDDKVHNVFVLDANTGIKIKTLTGSSNYPCSLSFSPDGRKVMAGLIGNLYTSVNMNVMIWNLENTDKPLFLDIGDTVTFPYASFSPDGKHIATSLRKFIKIWDANTGQQVSILTGL
jgi:WD40 repeat protein